MSKLKFVQIQEVGLGTQTPSLASIKRALKHSINSLYERLRNEGVDFASISSAFFRLDPAWNWEDFREDLLAAAYSLRKLANSRFPKAQCYLLFCAGFKHCIATMNGKVPPNELTLIADIRADELRKLADESGALYEANRYHFFRLPSGQTADFFLRAGNCLAKRGSLHILAFWALPGLKDTNLLVCDTWSISTLGMYLARLAERYTGQAYDCQYLSKYLSEDIESSNEVLEVLEQASDGRVAPVFLVSAISSGKSLRTYIEAFSTLFGDDRPNIVAIFLLGRSLAADIVSKADVSVLCSLSDTIEARGLKGIVEDTDLADGQQVFVVDSQTYFPRYFEPKEWKFFPSKFTLSSKPFFERYAGRGIFSVCRDGASNTKLNLRRHHAFHIDIRALIGTSEFHAKLSTLLKSISSPTHLIHLTKLADKDFAALIKKAVPNSDQVQLMECSSYKKLSKRADILNALADPNANVWFLDAMYISGQSTAQDFEQGLREGLGVLGLNEIPAQVSFFLGVLRPDLSKKISSDIKTMIRLCCPTRAGAIDVCAVEEVLLPNWDETHCPWCAERKLHTLLLSKHAKSGLTGVEKSYIESRLSFLTKGKRTGLTFDLFFKRYPAHEFIFNQGSLWFDWASVRQRGLRETEADIVLAVASALQYWRDDYGSRPPAQYLLDQQTCFAVNVYNETFLRAAIWRSLKRKEIDTFLNDKYRKDLLVRVFDSGGAADGADEFVLGWEAAMLLGRYLPRVIGQENFDVIDWNYLRWACLAT